MEENIKSNIDKEGNVLYLDQERLDRKVVGFPPYHNQKNGLGIKNWILEHIVYMSKKRWPLALKLYHMFIKFAPWMKQGGIKSKIYKTGIKLYPDYESHTSTIVMPLNVDVSKESEKVIIPIEFVKESLKKVDYIAGMDSCLCRDANDCKDYPHDLGCLFLGEAAKVVVKHELGRQFSYEEACERIDRASKEGLMAQAVWIEVEQMLWGVRNDMMDHFLEICFCCPCCCIALNLSRSATDLERIRFHPSGWTAVANTTKCVGCKRCLTEPHGCPVEAISFDQNNKIVINQEKCVGCGICKSRCKVDAIQIKQTMPMREDLQDYFLKDYNLDIKLSKGE